MKNLMLIFEIMEPEPVTVSDETTLSAAGRLLDEHGIRHLPVLRDHALVGVVSDRDLLETAGWLVPHMRGEDELELAPGIVRDVMQTSPVTTSTDCTLGSAASTLAQWGIGCLPVVRGEVLLGLVTATDLLETLVGSRRYGRLAEDDPRVEELMTRTVETLAPSATLSAAVQAFRGHDFRHLPIVDRGRLVGMLSDRDARRAHGAGRADETLASELMSHPVATVSPDTLVSRAARRMVSERIGALPVEDGSGDLIGILTVTDVLAHCVRALA